MSLNPSRVAISRTGWILHTIVVVALFVAANLTAHSSSHPGTVSELFFIAFIVGLGLALLLGSATLIRKRRTTHGQP